jgi:hypothetical protein
MAKDIENLLTQVAAISKKYEEIAKITGENFNVFNVLGLTIYEVRTHSAFIAELLNPNGSHGCNEIFLELFWSVLVKEFSEKKINLQPFQLNAKDASVIKEKNIGVINQDYTRGGNIDLLITDKSGCTIIIENKIYAGDQQKQLLRYYNYAEDIKTPYLLLYLTLDGKDATEFSTDKKIKVDKHYFLISYQSTIIDWLELCKKEAVNFPLLRETISQYIYLIKQLTHQTTNHTMSKEIINSIISNEANYKASQEIARANNSVNNELLQKLKSQLKSISEKLKLEFEFTLTQEGKCTAFRFASEKMKNNNIKLTFECDNKLTGFYFGFHWIDPKIKTPNIHPEELRNGFDDFGKMGFNENWFCFTNWNQHCNWSDKEFIQIINGELAFEIEELVKKLIDFIEAKLK